MKTIKNETNIEFEEKKSRFIGYVKPVQTKEEAEDFINYIKNKHKDATHNCSAYKITNNGLEFFKVDDDGEPSGTAGKPIGEIITYMGVTNLVVVVTRYFGGIKLDKQFNLTDLYTTYNKIGFSDSKLLAQIYSLEQSLSREDQAKQFAALKKAINKDASYIPICYRAYWFLTVETLKNADKVSFFSPYEGAEAWEWSKRKTE